MPIGIFLPIDKEIAVKFTELENKHLADAEYEMYTYLYAINNTDVERYGIPTVYYYGEWDHLIIMGLTLLDNGVDSKHLSESDVLIVLRDFVSFLFVIVKAKSRLIFVTIFLDFNIEIRTWLWN